MKKNETFIMLLCLLFLSISGCKKGSEITCNLSTAANQPPVDMSVVYTATQTGDGTISSLSYETITGTVTVPNPTLPWTVVVNVLSTTAVKISASGTTKNGSLKISYSGETSTSKISGSDYCEQQTN
jgi:hypothetical protein